MLLASAAPCFAGRIGFVDAERAVVSVEEGKVKMGELEAWADPQRERLEALAETASEARNQLAAQARIASAETLSALQEEDRRATRAFEDARRDFERQLEKKQNEFLAEVAVKVGQVASDYAKANDFDAVFVLKAQPLIYIDPEVELTDTIIRLYNERFPVE
jgi:outer membrane protein